jgi:hypothetical protein
MSARLTASPSTRLERAERWLLGAITAPSMPTGLRPLGGAAVPATVGLGIYRHAYRARLSDCLVDDFPAVRGLVGETAFATIVERVIDEHPPTDATLNRYGRRLPRWIATHLSAVPHGPIARDLARLEWALCEAIHEPLAKPVSPDDLAGIAPDAWADLRFARVPSLRLIRAVADVDLPYRLHLRGEPVCAPPRAAAMIVVLRRQDGLERHVLPPGPGRLLRSLAKGQTLGMAITAAGIPADGLAAACAAVIRTGALTLP